MSVASEMEGKLAESGVMETWQREFQAEVSRMLLRVQ